MGIAQSQFAPWTRKHDKPGTPLIPQAPTILYPQCLEDLIRICSTRPAGMRLHAAGSHWALSEAAISDHSFIETHDPNNTFPAMGRTLYEVVPGCLSDTFLNELNAPSSGKAATAVASEYYVHFESGKRIYQLYAELDLGDIGNSQSLCALMKSKFGNSSFEGSWGFSTLGGAGGQTVVGALSTGTHGGDFERPPIADSVVALHLVADGGKHYWIERGLRSRPFFTDIEKLHALYGAAKYGGPKNFEVIYDENILQAALVQVGRFGTVYSAVIKVTPQYGLLQDLKQDVWENIKGKITTGDPFLFGQNTTPDNQKIDQRFLQIVVNPIASTNGTTHICSITRRWTLPLASVDQSPLSQVTWGGEKNPAGRPEVVGNIVRFNDPLLHATRFAAAGNSVGYSPDDSGITSFNLLDAACADADFIDGIVNAIYTEIENFLTNNAVEIGGVLAGALAAGLGPGLAALAPELLAILALLALFLDALKASGQPARLGQAMNDLRGALLGSSNPAMRAAGIVVWRAIAAAVFKMMQPEKTYSAISYAVMDTHNYTDISCQVNVNSVEVFFDATDLSLVAFVDRLLKFEVDQEFESGDTVVGYISLRFTGQSGALIGQERWDRTCAIECSGLADVQGSTQFVEYATRLAIDSNLNGILHWGQQNESTQSDVEFRFGDAPGNPTGSLHDWRGVLAELTDNGRLNGYSSDFTRRTGLEVVQPVISAFALSGPPSSSTPSFVVTWDCGSNPPETTVQLKIQPPLGAFAPAATVPLSGSYTISAASTGVYTVVLVATLDRNGVPREATSALTVTVA